MDKMVEKEKRPVGRPRTGKLMLTLRLEPEVISFFKESGPGWLQRINDALKQSMISQREERAKEDAQEKQRAKWRMQWKRRHAKAHGTSA